ncbi:dephospho-CoA kinase [Nocardia sp. CA-290969]|uniref:dephospho-CoA kinase n=1 Tax=Nocardia sp. CA-290969 TaxID=3239986 RepID=UPI003D8E12C0
MLRIGLTGGMGAGKSTVARALAEHGAVIIDSDLIAREVVAPGTPGLAALVEAFGADILAADGSLDRPALAAKAFRDDESRATLNSITHPLVGQRTAELLAAAAPDAIVVQDVPLLVENNMAPFVNLVLVVDAATETRLRRLVEFRGVAEDDARARIAAQATDEQRYAAADVLLDNNGAAGAVAAEVARLWEQRLVPFEANMRAGIAVRPEFALVEARPEWAAQAQRLIARLRVAAGAAAVRVDHIGATAVPGLPAPDVLELQVTVADQAAADGIREALAGAGFPQLPRSAGEAAPGAGTADTKQQVHGTADPGRPVVVYLRVAGSPDQEFALACRDWLRAEEPARVEYADMVRAAAKKAEGVGGDDAWAEFTVVRESWLSATSQQVRDWRAEHPEHNAAP